MGGCGSKKASGGELILTEQDDSQRDINRKVKRERDAEGQTDEYDGRDIKERRRKPETQSSILLHFDVGAE